MKTSKILALTVAMVFLFVGIGFATPVYYGETDAGYGEGGNPSLPTATGYYIWSNDPERTSWSVRWTGNNDGAAEWYDWYGSIEIGGGLDLDGTVNEILFESGHSDDTTVYSVPSFGEIVTYDGEAGPHWDGFDFKITGSGPVIGFNLGSTAWELGAVNTEADGVGIFLGASGDIPRVLISDGDSGMTQNFEVPAPVPEPATILLFGAGLMGLAAYGRKKGFRRG